MNKSSKKRKKEAIKKVKAKLNHFPIETLEKIARLSTKSQLLPPSIALSPQIKEPQKFILRFDYLNPKECNFTQMDSVKGKALVEKFKYITSLQLNKFANSGIERDTITNRGGYKSLFKELPPDVEELKETELPGGGRVFYFIINENFCIVSIETKHRNID